MNRYTITKFVLAVAFTLALTFGIGIVGEQIGFNMTPTANACSHTSGGGC